MLHSLSGHFVPLDLSPRNLLGVHATRYSSFQPLLRLTLLSIRISLNLSLGEVPITLISGLSPRSKRRAKTQTHIFCPKSMCNVGSNPTSPQLWFLKSQSELASTMKLVILNSFDPLIISAICMSAPFPETWPVSDPGATGSLGTLKKSKTSRYSSSLGAGVLAGVTLGIRETIPTCFGCTISRSQDHMHNVSYPQESSQTME